MRYMKKSVGFMAVSIFLLFFAACGGGNKPNNPPDEVKPVSISIFPKTVLVESGIPLSLEVTVQNTDFTVSSVNPASGNCVKSGVSGVVCTPASSGIYDVTVTVRATADATKTATAQITVMTLGDFDHWFNGINNAGLIAGSFYDDFSGVEKAFVKDGGIYTVMDNPDSLGDTWFFGINDSVDVLGSYDSGYFVKTGTGYLILEDYEDLDGTHVTHYADLNNSGLLVGYFEDSADYARGFIRDGNVFTVIDHPDAVPDCGAYLYCGTWLSGINNSGHAVGVYGSADGVYRGFVYDGDVFTEIEHPDYGNQVNVYIGGINDSGLLSGHFWGSDGYAVGFTVVSDGGNFTVIDHSGAVSDGAGTYILGINNSGRIIGWFDDGVKARGFSIN